MADDMHIEMLSTRLFVYSQFTSAIPRSFPIEVCSAGAVSFVRMLLVMSGIEQNPGPTEKFIFRYQFLLIEIGTGVLRTLFNILVNNDFMKYLNANPKKRTQLKFLMNRDTITDEQKKFLPPLDTKPNSANFDVTLLACLLRNVCGLCHPKDPVWNNPPSTDLSIEADIVRLRQCRNNCFHSGTVSISETDLTTKWNELCTILNRLNNTCKIADLPKQMLDAEKMDVDEEMKKRHNDIIKLWREMDRSVDHGIGELIKKFENLGKKQEELITVQTELKTGQTGLKTGQVGLKTGQTELKTGQTEIKTGQTELKTGQTELKTGQTELKMGQTELKTGQTKLKTGQAGLITGQAELIMGQAELRSEQAELKTGQTELKGEMFEIKKRLFGRVPTGEYGYDNVDPATDLKQHLVETYNRDCCTLPLSPLYEEEEEDFFQVYQTPTMHQVDYHSSERTIANTRISSYRDIFVQNEQCFQNIYVTGDAGVGKTSLCKCLSLLWCKSQTGSTTDDLDIQRDINFLARFEFVFCISLRDTECRDVVSMIADQFFDSGGKEQHATIEHVLKRHKCLIIFDAFDDWSPKVRGKNECKLPLRVHSDNCVYLTTCRPYKIENVRLSRREIDQHVRVSGIHGESSKSFIIEVVKHMNKENKVDKNAEDFMREVEECGISEQLCIPMIASHLVVVWFAQTLTKMPKAALYGKIVELLFVRAKQRNVKSPASTTSELQLPVVLSNLRYLNEHRSLLQKVCLLSFRSLFKQDENVFSLVFTRHQLMSEPYLLCDEEMDFLCKIGILSKNKFIGCYEERKQKLSFLHKSYMEFFAALFVSSFDTEHVFNNVVTEWTSVNDVIQFQNVLILLAGFSYQRVKRLFDTIYLTISNDLVLCRTYAIFHFLSYPYMEQIKSLQLIVTNCWKEGGRCNYPISALQLQDYVFDDNSNVETLNQLLLSNASVVKSLYSVNGRYNFKFGQIKNLQCLNIGRIVPGDYTHFNECMLQNQATLHTVFIHGNCDTPPLLSELPVRNLPHLTSLSLTGIKMEHNSLHHLVNYLSNNVLIENIRLVSVLCDNHQKDDDGDCTMLLNLHNHSHLTYLKLLKVNILCRDVNITCLKYLALLPSSEKIASCYMDVLKCITGSQLDSLAINGDNKLDNNTINTLISTIKTLSDIKHLVLVDMILLGDELFHLHPHVTQVEIVWLENVTWSCKCFHSFVHSVIHVDSRSVKSVLLYQCKVLSVHGNTRRQMSELESIDYMFKHLEQQPTVNILYKRRLKGHRFGGDVLLFNTTSRE